MGAITKQDGPQDREAGLTPAGRQHLADVRARNALIVAITNESWGQAMPVMLRRAFAEYMRRFNLDVSEVDNLGGKPYRNGFYYRRRIAEMRAAGKIEWSEGEHIGVDPQLDALAAQGDEWAIREQTRRLRERIRHAVPAGASAVYVARVKLKADGKPLEGCDWILPGAVKKTKYGDKVADPVGEAEPTKTAETRAWRRVGLLVAAEIPELGAEEARLDAEATVIADAAGEIAGEERLREAEAERMLPARGTEGGALQGVGGYGDEITPPSQPVTVVQQPDEFDLDQRRFEGEGEEP